MSKKIDFQALAKGFISTLSLPSKRFEKPIAILLVGIPASGKSYLAAQVTTNFPFINISENSVESYLISQNIEKRERDILLILAKNVIRDLISDSTCCIFDASLKTFYEREEFRKTIKAAGGEVLTVYFDIHPNVCFARIEERNKKIMDGELKGTIMNRQYFFYEVNTTEKPKAEEKAFNLQISNKDSLKIFLGHLAISLKKGTAKNQ